MPDIELIKITLQLGAFGVLVWLVYQQNTKTIPNILREQTEQINKFLALLSKMIEDDRNDHRLEIDKIIATQDLIRDRIHSMAEAVHNLVGQNERERNSRG